MCPEGHALQIASVHVCVWGGGGVSIELVYEPTQSCSQPMSNNTPIFDMAWKQAKTLAMAQISKDSLVLRLSLHGTHLYTIVKSEVVQTV